MITTAHRHPIQLHIFEQLRAANAGLRYTDMRPAEVESDLYNYHLRQLVRSGLVEKFESQKYRLTPQGKRYIFELNPVTELGESHRFKLASLCLVLRQGPMGLDVLYQLRTRQPHAGEQGIIGGGIKRGELAVEAAKRRLTEEAGLQADFTLLGLIRKRHFDPAGDIYSDILFHVCLTRAATGTLVQQNQFGEQAWIPIEEAIELETTSPIGSRQFAGVLRQLVSTPPDQIPLFYFEETYQREIY
jgi:8-oxo-dGTP pyrophosphatase MutT (NUDIX family)